MAQYHDMRFAATRPDGTEVWEDALYANRSYGNSGSQFLLGEPRAVELSWHGNF